MQQEPYVMIVTKDNTVDRVKIFDNYWEGARYTEHYIEKYDDGSFYSIVIGKCYDKDGITIGLYRGEVCE